MTKNFYEELAKSIAKHYTMYMMLVSFYHAIFMVAGILTMSASTKETEWLGYAGLSLICFSIASLFFYECVSDVIANRFVEEEEQ